MEVFQVAAMALVLLALAVLIFVGGRPLRPGARVEVGQITGPWPKVSVLVPVTGAAAGLATRLERVAQPGLSRLPGGVCHPGRGGPGHGRHSVALAQFSRGPARARRPGPGLRPEESEPAGRGAIGGPDSRDPGLLRQQPGGLRRLAQGTGGAHRRGERPRSPAVITISLPRSPGSPPWAGPFRF